MSLLAENLIFRLRRDGPLTAAALGEHLGLDGDRENQRRVVRRLVKELREDGHRICADIPGGQQGYWLARIPAEWTGYVEARKTGARFEFVRMAKVETAAREKATCQEMLF